MTVSNAPWPVVPPMNTNSSPLMDTVPHYPASFPLPDRQPYAYGVDMGVVRSQMAAGNARQRRLYRFQPHMLQLSFHLRFEDLYEWQNWVSAWAYSWFALPVSTKYAGGPPIPSSIRPEVVRFTSDLAVTMEGWDYVAVTVAAEMSIDAEVRNPPIGVSGWVIGGTPAGPSDAWMIGGTPASPSPDWAIGGTPDLPSSLV